MESGAAGVRADHAAPGVALRAARVAQNLGLAEVARQLRLSVPQVEALESGAFERLPGPVFVRGFIRNYARLLKLDGELLLRSASLTQAPDQDSPVAPPARGEPMPAARAAHWPRYVAVTVAVLLALAAYELFFAEAPPEVGVTSPPSPVVVTVPVAPPPAQSEAPPSAASEGPIRIQPPSIAADAPAETPVAAPAAAAGVRPVGEGELRLKFVGDSWVEVRDGSGRTILSQVHRQGTEQRVQGRAPLVVVVGNARGVRLTYNDREVDLEQHIKGDVARLTLQ